ncbi:MAG: M15 family metallopeptidase [Patescibacteria group bacterium]
MINLNLLKPKVKLLAEELIKESKKIGVQIILVQGFRSTEEQDALYAKGRTEKGKIVTNAKGGQSFHNYGVAFDVCPIVNGKVTWKYAELFKKVGSIGESIGLEWGGNWKKFKDLPHFQYTAGYTLAQFKNNKIDTEKFS